VFTGAFRPIVEMRASRRPALQRLGAGCQTSQTKTKLDYRSRQLAGMSITPMVFRPVLLDGPNVPEPMGNERAPRKKARKQSQ